MTQLIMGAVKPAVAPASAPTATGVDFVTDMPDQTEEPAAYAAALQDRTNRALASISHATTANVDRAAKLNDLWTQFRTDHEDLAKHPGIIEQATRDVVADIKGRGGDPSAAVLGDGKSFMDAVAVRANSAIDRIRGASPPGGGDNTHTPAAQITTDATRTAGVSGGSTEHGSGGGSGNDKTVQPSTMVDELKAAQRKSGFF